MSLLFYENRNTYVRVQLKEIKDGVEQGVDIWSNPAAQVLFRAFQLDDTLIQEVQMDKVDPQADPANNGIVDKYILFDQAYSTALVMRFILQDTATIDTNTRSGFREEVWDEFKRVVESSPA